METVCADAKLWAASALRVYMITGAPGVGKSEFTIWLAAQLDLPVYRLCLTSPRLTDDRLAQLLSQSAVTHNSMLVQVDEFQEAVRHWVQSKTSTGDTSAGVTPGGFCEVLQGSTAMGRGVIVLTGTCEIVDPQVMRRLSAVFRRIHLSAHLSWMSVEDVARFFNQFLLRFVPSCPANDWKHWERGRPMGGSQTDICRYGETVLHAPDHASELHGTGQLCAIRPTRFERVPGSFGEYERFVHSFAT